MGLSYKLASHRRGKTKLLYSKWLLGLVGGTGLLLIAWWVWVRPAVGERVASFEQCQAAGNPIQESYPEVCLAPDGKRFVNLKQDAAHQASLSQAEELAPPTNPKLLQLDIDEWGVRVPLTTQTFDLIYTYVEYGASESVTFTFKRLVNAGFCLGDIGLSLTRSTVQHQVPFSPDNPEPLAQIGQYYYYAAVGGSPCFDPDDPAQVSLAKDIAGEASLTQAVISLASKLQAQAP